MTDEQRDLEATEGELVTQPPKQDGIVRVQGDVVAALAEYKKLQKILDNEMPESRMTIRGKLFRKKSYWRGVAMFFNLDVELLGEQQIVDPGDEKNWGWIVTYCAKAKNGRYALGDGACTISEKEGKMKTVHNVRAHAHTRGFNRAVSNLVGFGEVSAEEMVHEHASTPPASGPTHVVEEPPHVAESPEGGPMTAPQRAKLKATVRTLADKSNKNQTDYFQNICSIVGLKHIKSSTELSKNEASKVIDKLEELQEVDG